MEEKKPFKDIEKGLDFGLDGIIDSLKELSNNKLKVGFWENSFFLQHLRNTLLSKNQFPILKINVCSKEQQPNHNDQATIIYLFVLDYLLYLIY